MIPKGFYPPEQVKKNLEKQRIEIKITEWFDHNIKGRILIKSRTGKKWSLRVMASQPRGYKILLDAPVFYLNVTMKELIRTIEDQGQFIDIVSLN